MTMGGQFYFTIYILTDMAIIFYALVLYTGLNLNLNAIFNYLTDKQIIFSKVFWPIRM